jgi:hypothetical protein
LSYTEQAGQAEFVIAVPQKITPALKVRAETAPTFRPAGSLRSSCHAFCKWHCIPHGSSFIFLALPRSVLHTFRPSVGKAKKPTAAHCCARLRCHSGCGIVMPFAKWQKPRQPLFNPFRLI